MVVNAHSITVKYFSNYITPTVSILHRFHYMADSHCTCQFHLRHSLSLAAKPKYICTCVCLYVGQFEICAYQVLSYFQYICLAWLASCVTGLVHYGTRMYVCVQYVSLCTYIHTYVRILMHSSTTPLFVLVVCRVCVVLCTYVLVS